MKRPAGRSPFAGIVRIRYLGSPLGRPHGRRASQPSRCRPGYPGGPVRSSSLSRLADSINVLARDEAA
jgi:hypothetical protein